MALLDNLEWMVTSNPSKAALLLESEGRFYEDELTEEDRAEIILPGQLFSLVYPIRYTGNVTRTIDYDPEGIPVSVQEILNIIYEFYNAPLTDEDIIGLYRNKRSREDLCGADNLGHILADKIYFSGLQEIDPNVYRVLLK